MSTPSPIAQPSARREHEGEHASAVRSMFDRIAPTYDTLNGLLSAGADRRWRSRAVEALRGGPEGAVLDLCAGTMDLTALVAQAFPQRRVVAADFAPHMLERGKAKAPKAERVVADACDLPFPSRSFAAVVCGFGVRNVADLDKALAEVKRILLPGGILVTLEFFKPERLVTRLFHDVYAKHVMPVLGGWVSGERAAYDYLAKSMGAFATRREYETSLSAMGFENVRGEDQWLAISSIVKATAPT